MLKGEEGYQSFFFGRLTSIVVERVSEQSQAPLLAYMTFYKIKMRFVSISLP